MSHDRTGTFAMCARRTNTTRGKHQTGVAPEQAGAPQAGGWTAPPRQGGWQQARQQAGWPAATAEER